MGSRARGRDEYFPDLRRDAGYDFFLAQHRWERVLIMSPALSAAMCRVALVLLKHANFKEFDRNSFLLAWPSQKTIARLIEQSERAVWDSVWQLRAAGVVSVRRKGRGYSYTFQLSWREKAEAAIGPKLEEWPDAMLKTATKSRRKRRD